MAGASDPEEDSESAPVFGATSPAVDIALSAARKRQGRTYDPVDAFLEDQRSLIGDQRHHLRAQMKQLSLKSIEQRITVALMLLTVAAGAAIVLVLGAAAWNAHNASGVVVETFAAPPDMATHGLSGEVLAARFADKLAAIDAQAYSTRAQQAFERAWSRDLQVEIPNTKISLSAAYSDLERLLGHQTRVTGDLIRTADGASLTVRAGADAIITVAGPEADLDSLLRRAAEQIFGETQPFRYSRYLAVNRRAPEALGVARDLARNGGASEKPWALTQVSLLLSNSDLPGAVDAAARAIDLMPQLGTAHFASATALSALGHDEAALAQWREAGKMRHGGDLYSARGVALGFTSAATAADAVGDWRGAASLGAQARSDKATGLDPAAGEGELADRLALLHEVTASRRPAANADPAQAPLIAYDQAVALEDWPGALAALRPHETRTAGDTAKGVVPDQLLNPDLAKEGYAGAVRRERVLAPTEAIALAHAGYAAQARSLAETTPTDCVLCLRARGLAAALAGDAAGADHAFAEAVRQGPSLPFAYAEWGQAKLARGDVAGAEALFRQARQKGPRWADAAKLEGDALARLGKPQEAVSAYAAAAALTPRWGALHLKWGETLAKLGRADDARAMFRAAAAMDLSAADRAELAAQRR